MSLDTAKVHPSMSVYGFAKQKNNKPHNLRLLVAQNQAYSHQE